MDIKDGCGRGRPEKKDTQRATGIGEGRQKKERGTHAVTREDKRKQKGPRRNNKRLEEKKKAKNGRRRREVSGRYRKNTELNKYGERQRERRVWRRK